MKKLILLIACTCYTSLSSAQYTQVPDPNFEQALIDLGIDSEGILDGQFLTADAENVSSLYVNNSNIIDLTGIEAFVNLEWLDASENIISSLDLSLITSPIIWYLNLGDNNLTSIDLSHIPNILNIGLYKNNFSFIDVSNLTQAFVLSLSENPLVEISLHNTHIQVLELENLPLTTIDLSTVQGLQRVSIQESQIQSLDFSNNPILEEVYAYNTPLTSINLPNNPNLVFLSLYNTQLTELNVTNCPSLETLWADNCSLSLVALNSGLLEAQLKNNLLSTIDLSQSNAPLKISLNNNLFTTIDLSQSTSLFGIELDDNLIANLDFSNNPNLDFVAFENNPLTTVNFNGATALREVHAKETLLTEVDFSNNPNLDFLNFNYNEQLQLVNLKNGNNSNLTTFAGQYGNPILSCVVVDDPLAPNENIYVQQEVMIIGDVTDCILHISEYELQNLTQTYPNPVKNTLNINPPNNFQIHKIAIYDILGRVVLQANNPSKRIDVSKLSRGILFVQLETDQGIITKKIIKE